MADKKTKTQGKVTVRLPILKDPKAPKEEFYSVNGKNYIIKRGERVTIPEALAEVIEHSAQAEEAAYTEEYENYEIHFKTDFDDALFANYLPS